MDFKKDDKIAVILAEKFSGELSSEQQALLDEWLESSPDNKTLHDEFMAGKTVSEYHNIASGINKVRGLRKIDRGIRRAKIRRITKWSASAAAVIAAVGVFSLSLIDKDRKDRNEILNTVNTVGHIAIMHIDDREPVLLTDAHDGSAWHKHITAEKESPGIETIRIETPRGAEYKVDLPDGTIVWLNSESSIEYPKEFTENRRSVRLSGEAYFEVVRDEQKQFVVENGNAKIVVLGTSFNVTAYDSDETITATLVSGSVEVITPHTNTRLTPRDQVIVNRTTGNINVRQVNTEIYTSWTTNVMEFKDMRLADVCTRLTRWYNVDFEFEGGSGEELFTGGTWKDVPLGDFLTKIEQVIDVVFRVKNGKIVVSTR
ncbi:MAG: FecR domain-containing protein [Rikenellaceae bacterium]|nr:FecR domain-containing protein [Rikenellaceae bacterium]MCL2693124.1 FecR domain-containing protein [Rikenellaceae bacterium]